MPYPQRDNEFIAWYPCALEPSAEDDVWPDAASSFYVHIPFCEAICDYCGFSVATLKSGGVTAYADALIAEIQHYASRGRFAQRQFVCGGYGGGTPSAIEADVFSRIATCISDNLPIVHDAEITIEANPLSLTPEKAIAYRAAGVNRLSLGVQAFNETVLRTIGRPHRAGDIWRGIEIAAKHFENFSLDLMYGAPGETLDMLRADLELAINSGAPHLSCFRLEIIPFTRLGLRRGAGLTPTASHTDEEIEALLVETLRSAGYRQYGAFNFAKPGFESIHNDTVFSTPQCDFFGFGNSAFSYVNGVSYCNHTEIQDYLRDVQRGVAPISHARRATMLEVMSRYFVLGLKLRGVARDAFEHRAGLAPELVFGPVLESLRSRGLLDLIDNTYLLTTTGRHYVNNICKEFYVGPNIGRRQHQFSFVPQISAKDVELVQRRAAKAHDA